MSYNNKSPDPFDDFCLCLECVYDIAVCPLMLETKASVATIKSTYKIVRKFI